MRVLLINSNRFHQPWPVIPNGLCSVAATSEAAGHDVRLLDLCFEDEPAEAIRRELREYPPEAVGVSLRNIDNCAAQNPHFLIEEVQRDVVAPLREAFDGPIVLGGPAVGINPEQILEFLGLDFAVRGDGEQPFLDWLAVVRGELLGEVVAGLVGRRPDGSFYDNPPASSANLDALKWPRCYRYVDVDRYCRHNAALPVRTKRGCPLQCSYCTYNAIEGRKWRLRDPNQIAAEIADLVTKTGIRTIEFTDSTFNLPLDHAKQVLRAIEATGLRLRLRTLGLNPGAVDEELADLMQRTGFSDVDIGAESGSNAMLRSLGKNFRKSDLNKTGRLLRERGIPVTWYLMLGAPGETAATVAETFATMDEVVAPWDLINISMGLRVYNGAPIANQPELVSNDCFFRPVALHPSKTLSLGELRQLVAQQAAKRDNCFVFEEEETTPLWLLAAGRKLLDVLAPKQPLFRLHILKQKMRRAIGLTKAAPTGPTAEPQCDVVGPLPPAGSLTAQDTHRSFHSLVQQSSSMKHTDSAHGEQAACSATLEARSSLG